MLLAAAPVRALVIYGSIILYDLGMPAWTSAPLGVPQDASAQREEERKAKAASEAEAKRKAEQAEQQRLAALKAEGDRKQTEAAVPLGAGQAACTRSTPSTSSSELVPQFSIGSPGSPSA